MSINSVAITNGEDRSIRSKVEVHVNNIVVLIRLRSMKVSASFRLDLILSNH